MNSSFCNIGSEFGGKIQKPRNTNIEVLPMDQKCMCITPKSQFVVANIIDVTKPKNGSVDNINFKTMKISFGLIVESSMYCIIDFA